MKNIIKRIFFYIGCMTFLITSCEEEGRDSFFSDGTPPGPVTEVTFDKIHGGAVISYKLPSDSDLLLVTAEYTLPSGKVAKLRATSFNNSIKVVGLLDSINMHKVTLFAEDNGGIKSEPTIIEVGIKQAPIYRSANTVTMIPDFGGVRLNWSGIDKSRLTTRLLVNDENGFPLALHTQVVEDSSVNQFIQRGFGAIPVEFFVEISDKWGNKAPLVKKKLTPLKEELVPKETMSGYELPHDLTNDPNNPQWNFTKMWDGAEYQPGKRDWLSPDSNGTVRDPNPLPEYNPNPPYNNPESHLVTIDLGRLVKLSRFKYFQDTAYNFGAFRFFDMWVTSETPNPDGTLEGWTRVFQRAEITKPSGERRGINTQVDIDTAAKGDEFIFPLDLEEVRYVRFGLLENFIGTVVFTGQEFSFYGQFD